MRYKKWIDAVDRIRGGTDTRFDKVRLDKNERLAYFNDEFWNYLISKIRQEHVLAYPEVEPFYIKLTNFLGVTAEHLIVTAGSDLAIKAAFEVFVSPGGAVIYLDPTFAMVDVYCELFNAEKVKIGYDSGLAPDTDKLMDAINEKTSLIIIANPNSPTGTYIDNDMLEIIIKKANDFSVPVLIDEAYYGFCSFTAFNLLKSYDNLIITRTFSKTAGLAGLRIGYIVAQPQLARLLYKFRPMYEVNAVAVLFASEILDNREIVNEYVNATNIGKSYLINALKALSFKVIDTYTNFIHVDFGLDRDKILNGLKRDNILLRGSLGVKGFESYARISVGNIEEMKKVIMSVNVSG